MVQLTAPLVGGSPAMRDAKVANPTVSTFLVVFSSFLGVFSVLFYHSTAPRQPSIAFGVCVLSSRHCYFRLSYYCTISFVSVEDISVRQRVLHGHQILFLFSSNSLGQSSFTRCLSIETPFSSPFFCALAHPRRD